MADKTSEKINTERIYTLLLALKQEVSRLSLQVKALRSEVKGVTENGT